MTNVIKEPMRLALFELRQNQTWLADKLGMKKQQLSRYTTAKRVHTDVIDRIAEALGYTADNFLGLGSEYVTEDEGGYISSFDEDGAIDAAGKACCSDDA